MDRSERLDAFLDRRDLAAVWFARPASFAWLTRGSNVVDAHAPVGIAAAGYDGDLRVVTNDVEAERLREEELSPGVAVESYPWHASSLADSLSSVSPEPAAADFHVPGFEQVDASALRQPLSDHDVENYRALGRDAAHAVESVCESASQSDTEQTVAASVRERLAVRGVRAPVVLVGGERRSGRYRHFTPKDETLDGYALVSVTAERGGLHASLTRTVAFDPPAWLEERSSAAARIETDALFATREFGARGGTAGDVFAAIQAAYGTEGHPDEWRKHHQGGAAGFSGREWIATPDAEEPIRLPMAFAWNPTISGAKSENTWLVTSDGVEPLTVGTWGTRLVEGTGSGRSEVSGDSLEHPESFLQAGTGR